MATYRLQLNRDLGFARALGLVDYLHGLGVGACYLSPLLEATPGSNHGYDVVDHGRINPELGTEDELIAFASALSRRARLELPIGARWAATTIHVGGSATRYRDALTGETHTVENGPERSLAVARVFAHLPVAVLEAL